MTHYLINLTTAHASKEPLFRSMMDTVEQTAFSGHYSAQRLHVYQAELKLDEDSQAGMNDITNVYMYYDNSSLAAIIN